MVLVPAVRYFVMFTLFSPWAAEKESTLVPPTLIEPLPGPSSVPSSSWEV